jgi:hypothetical protein
MTFRERLLRIAWFMERGELERGAHKMRINIKHQTPKMRYERNRKKSAQFGVYEKY